jgi:hypothetical protein
LGLLLGVAVLGLSAGRGHSEAVSWWSARSEARTYDLDAVEDGRMMAGRPGSDWDGVSGVGLGLLGGGGLAGGCAPGRPGLSRCSDSHAVRRRDDRWGDPGCCSAVARSFRADQRSLATVVCWELTAGHQLNVGLRARTEHLSRPGPGRRRPGRAGCDERGGPVCGPPTGQPGCRRRGL